MNERREKHLCEEQKQSTEEAASTVTATERKTKQTEKKRVFFPTHTMLIACTPNIF